LTEADLIARLRKGDEAAFKWLVTSYQDRVYNTSLGLLQNQMDAEDTAQDVFVIIYKSIGQFKEASKLSTWIYRITVTCCLDKIRSKKRKKRFALLTGLFNKENVLVVDPENFVHPGVLLDRKEEARLLFELIQELPARQTR
jgi:RNA polymerase sigma-70 factor (ECF subfamily)